MDANEAITIALSKIKEIDPDNASKIMGYLLVHDLADKDLISLAFCTENTLRDLILKVKSQLCLHSPSPRISQRSDLGAAGPFSGFFVPPFNAGIGRPGDLGEDSEHYKRHLTDAPTFPGQGMDAVDAFFKASRQIYLTFRPESSFEDAYVLEYFSKYGPVEGVELSYKPRGMFGFVTFIYPETVQLILMGSKTHYICNSRVCVKPYKLKPEVFEMYAASTGILQWAPRLLGLREYHPGARGFHNSREMMLKRKFEGQANSQRAIEMPGRKSLDLKLPNLKDDDMYHHMQYLSLRKQFSANAAPLGVFNRNAPEDCWNNPAILVSSAAKNTNVSASDNILIDEQNGHDPSSNESLIQGRNTSGHLLPDFLFASPTKSKADHHPDFSN